MSPIVALAVLSVAPAAWASESEQETQAPVVICILRPGEPWREVTRGKLIKRSSDSGIAYKLDAGGRTIDYWTWRRSDGGRHVQMGPPLLSHTFAAEIRKLTFPRGPIVIDEGDFPQRLSVNAKGEIREVAGAVELASIVGSKCPK